MALLALMKAEKLTQLTQLEQLFLLSMQISLMGSWSLEILSGVLQIIFTACYFSS